MLLETLKQVQGDKTILWLLIQVIIYLKTIRFKLIKIISELPLAQ